MDVGETIIEYKGIILYEVNKEKINVEDFGIKDNNKKNQYKGFYKEYNKFEILFFISFKYWYIIKIFI